MDHNRDRQIVRGLDALINKDLVAPGTSLRDIEKALLNETPDYKRASPEPMNGLIHEIGNQFGIDIEDIVGSEGARDNGTRDNGTRDNVSTYNGTRSSPQHGSTRASPQHGSERSSERNNAHGGDSTRDNDIYERSSRPTPPSVYEDDPDDDDDAVDGLYSRDVPLAPGYTREQRHRTNFNSVISHDQDFSNRLELGDNMEDEKAEMLADIELLLSALEADGVPIERLEQTKPTMDSSYKQVQSFFRGLQKKVDKNRGSAIIEEGVIFAVSLLEDLFDGKNEYFSYKPDLTGYSNTARTKMRRLRPESSVLASSVLHSSSMGPGTRMMLELIPSMVLHSRARRQQHGETGVFDDSSMVSANTIIRRHSEG